MSSHRETDDENARRAIKLELLRQALKEGLDSGPAVSFDIKVLIAELSQKQEKR